MANITDQDIIDHLKEKINFHQQEAKRLQSVLSAFMPPAAIPGTGKGKAASAKTAEAAAKPATKQQPAIQPVETDAALPQDFSPLQIPPKYTDSLSVEAKIAFALNEIQSGFSEDIASTMAQYEPKSDAKAIGRQIAGILITLKNEGKIQVEKVGRKDKFSLTTA